jgi:hypothetical protein
VADQLDRRLCLRLSLARSRIRGESGLRLEGPGDRVGVLGGEVGLLVPMSDLSKA